MSILFEKLLLEESQFDDAQDFTETDQETSLEDETAPVEDSVVDGMNVEAPTVTYKVSFTLGKHENWSRIDASSEEEAGQLVQDYITKKWPDREFKIIKIEKFDEEEMAESLTESITDAQPIETGAAVGMASVISDLIKDEYEAIDGYNSAIATAEAEGFGDMVNVLSEIQAEENLHIGQLQTLMTMVDPNAHLVDDGQQEGIEQLANPLGGEVVEESLTEDLDDMSLQDQRMFIRCVNEIWNMSVLEWTQKYYAGQLEVVNVNSYSDIPNTSNLIDISSSDISQGTGNVVVYTCMDAGDGTLYRYADF
jgi:hypothetical protein